MPTARTRSKRRGKPIEEVAAPGAAADNAETAAQAQLIPAYAQGHGAVVGVPLLDSAPAQTMPLEDEENEPQAPREESPAEVPPEVSSQSIAAVADVSGQGEETYATAYSITLRGRTDASFSSSFSTQGVVTSPGNGCTGCTGSDCVHVSGTLVSTFRVTTTVTLPSVNDFPGLRPCQRQRVQDAITNVLAPHEQQHVTAFQTYNGTTQRPFDLTICRGDFNSTMQSMHDSADNARQSAARALSNALDPFQFDVDTNCEDSPDAGRSSADAGAASPQAAGPAADELESMG